MSLSSELLMRSKLMAILTLSIQLTLLDLARAGKISESVFRILLGGSKPDIIITVEEGLDEVLDKISSPPAAKRTNDVDHTRRLKEELESHSKKSLSDVLKLLHESTTGGDSNSSYEHHHYVFWNTNQVFVKEADMKLLEALKGLNGVKKVDMDKYGFIKPPQISTFHPISVGPTIPWNLLLTGAPHVWEKDIWGGNVRVGIIDTGLRATHDAIRSNYLGYHNESEGGSWFDPWDLEELPVDVNGRGTHLAGIIAGTNGIGMAPKAQILACRSCKGSVCSLKHTIACLQFMICPDSGSCATRPHILLLGNMFEFDANLQFAIEAVIEANIVLVAPIGDRGPQCSSGMSPGRSSGVVAVGSVGYKRVVSQWSSSGPGDGVVKPDFVAPGENVLSAWITHDTDYSHQSGTAVAAAHVAGALALVLSTNMSFTNEDLLNRLKGATRPTTGAPQNCGGLDDNKVPNNRDGWGIVNSYKALFGKPRDSKGKHFMNQMHPD